VPTEVKKLRTRKESRGTTVREDDVDDGTHGLGKVRVVEGLELLVERTGRGSRRSVRDSDSDDDDEDGGEDTGETDPAKPRDLLKSSLGGSHGDEDESHGGPGDSTLRRMRRGERGRRETERRTVNRKILEIHSYWRGDQR
jgi:hypothetical protein